MRPGTPGRSRPAARFHLAVVALAGLLAVLPAASYGRPASASDTVDAAAATDPGGFDDDHAREEADVLLHNLLFAFGASAVVLAGIGGAMFWRSRPRLVRRGLAAMVWQFRLRRRARRLRLLRAARAWRSTVPGAL